MKHIEELALQNQQKAWKIIEKTNIIGIWKSIGAEINLVGSLSTGLLMKHRDIDFHIYTNPLNVSDSFKAISRLAENKSIKKIEFTNLLDTEESCLEWHAWYEDDDKQIWQIDMIHILKGSRYDGYFENVAKRISAVLTEEIKNSILKLKFETPDDHKIMGILYYQAVIGYNINTYSQFEQWLQSHPVDGVLEWMP